MRERKKERNFGKEEIGNRGCGGKIDEKNNDSLIETISKLRIDLYSRVVKVERIEISSRKMDIDKSETFLRFHERCICFASFRFVEIPLPGSGKLITL